ncbi:hypothetical protein GTY66_13275 [Streptomyces sp. SID8356]|uniref:hypothetical protein n=1 Tax=unclassified Streptomyces TaxID=2593676 RepID=UPI000476C480|nr:MULTISPECIES: hypothetical protein [unclassified Streptomyces]MYT37015.1 hypothetical protein [Streptomyces sp. SID8356]
MSGSVARRPSIETYEGEFTLKIRSSARKQTKEHRSRLLIVPPMVGGTVTWADEGRTGSTKGFFVLRERRSHTLRGELTIVIERDGAQWRLPFETEYGSLAGATESLKKALTGRRSADLRRHLGHILAGAEQDLAETRRACAELAGRDAPKELLRHAEELWNQARLLLLLGDVEEAASRAVHGVERATRSGLRPGAAMATSGVALAYVLGTQGQARAAEQVRAVTGGPHA